MMKKEFKHLSFDWVANCLDIFASDLERHNHNYSCIVPVVRGGLAPAVMLSHRLKLPLGAIIHARSYGDDHLKTAPAVFYVPLVGALDMRRALIVEDIVDTGDTLNAIAEHPVYGKCDVFALVEKKRSAFRGRLHAGMIDASDAWIVFPWEWDR